MKLQIDRNNLLLILILIIASFRSFAQIDILRFRPIELPHQIPYIQCLYQDNNGIIWLGTFDGLFQYDGYELVQYSNDPGDSLSLSDNKIQCIIEDAWGNLLIGTQSGLQYFDRRKMVFHKIDEMENQYVSKLVSGGDGEIYALSEMGVYRLHSNNVSGRHELNKIMDSHSAHSVIYTADQKLLITNGEQLYEINVGTNEDHEIEIFSMSDFKGTSITYLSVDSMGRIWISTNAGIHQFDPTTEKITAFAAWPRLAEKTQENIILEIDSIRFLVTNDQEIWEFDIQSKSFKGIFLEQHEMDQYNKYAFSLDILKTNQNNIMLCIDGKSLYQYNSDRSYLSLFPTDLFEKLLGPGLFYEIFEFQKNKIFISDKEYPKLLDLSDGSIKPFPYSLTPLMKSEPVWFTTFQAIDNNIWIGS
ncbi:MAG: hypothetical protein KDC53_22045, partial [Saprospiraceae bacterium]|nr:hypothetical protein [Saprospiraceae bacterium]